ncbi:efflux transporter outer membrane subunit [Duganella dendranthematis]|uniref:Efflux transporter outer membrane subunit n=1 Tax=Duganella dendranthematis TaxID=2728021 RepID=A0ABX6M8E7_9BURK|nr:efflux transporter outer membrane subunit [Duganella dendranthematis]QJD90584.1 efflux transporter outer membrane subunit [Duganella dendranthematis]
MKLPIMTILASLLAGCAAPNFSQPVIDTPSAFKEASIQTAADGSRWVTARPAEQQPRGEWWRAFGDPVLDELIADATRSNANLALAAARVKQARAITGIAEADRVPQVDLAVGAQRARSAPAELGIPAGSPVAPQTTYRAHLMASYEVDLFGRVSSNVAAASADADAAEASYRSVLLALQADVAQHYFLLRATDAELETLARTVQTREENVKVNQRRFDLGDIGEFDLARALTELSTTRADAIGLQQRRVTTEHALAVLLGKPAASYTVEASSLLDNTRMPAIPPGLPSTLLERRPDIAAAQRIMEAANARIGIARSAMFPALNINAAGGGVAGNFPDVLTMTGRSWVLGALLAAPVIDGGRRRADVTRSEAVLEESVAAYRHSVLTAFAEVEDNLAGLRILHSQSTQIEDALISARRSAELAHKLYDAGRSNYLELLDAERNLATVERSAVQLRGNRAISTVALIRALGGGWDVPRS